MKPAIWDTEVTGTPAGLARGSERRARGEVVNALGSPGSMN